MSSSPSISVSSSSVSTNIVGTNPTTGSVVSKSIKLPDKYDKVAKLSLLDNASVFNKLFKFSKSAEVHADNVNTKLSVTNNTSAFFMLSSPFTNIYSSF